jgi:DNA-binding beta-propeller fold protein YncE
LERFSGKEIAVQTVRFAILGRLALTLPILFPLASAQQQGQPTAGYQLLNTIKLPQSLLGNDISWVDSANARYYLADRGAATATPPTGPRIDVIDTENNALITTIPMPNQALTGTTFQGAGNGILAIPRSHEIWVGCNDSTVVVIDTLTNAVTHTISTGGTARADEMAYDPAERLFLVANDRDATPFVTFISTVTYQVVKQIYFDGTSAPKSTGGIEQPVWDGPAGKFYIAIPATATNPKGEYDEFDPLSLAFTRGIPSTCTGPSGLALIPGQRLISACGDVVDLVGGHVVTTVNGVSADEIWYNAGDQRVYFSGGVNVFVVDANTYALVATLPVGVAAVAGPPAVPAQSTHSLAADEGNNEIFVAVAFNSTTGAGPYVGIQVWRNGASLTAIPNPIPVTGNAFLGTATLKWNAPNAQVIEIHVGSPTGPLFTQNGNKGTAITGQWVTDGMTFYLQDVTGGKPLTTANTLATATVHLQKL